MSNDDNIITFPGATMGEIAPDLILDSAKGKLTSVLLLGTDSKGNHFIASSTGDSAQLLWMIECFRFDLLSGTYGE